MTDQIDVANYAWEEAIRRAPVRSGLQEEDLCGGVLAQAPGDHAAGAAAADDKEVGLDRSRHHASTFIHTLLIWVISSTNAAPSILPWPESLNPPYGTVG